MKEISKIDFSEVKPFISTAKKERVSFENPDGAEWLGIYDDGVLIAFCCLVFKERAARFKSNYTVRERRGEGCLNAFIDYAVKECLRRKVNCMTAFCTPLSVKSHLKSGAVAVSKNKDITFVKYTFRR